MQSQSHRGHGEAVRAAAWRNMTVIHLELHGAQTHCHRKRLSETSECLQQQREDSRVRQERKPETQASQEPERGQKKEVSSPAPKPESQPSAHSHKLVSILLIHLKAHPSNPKKRFFFLCVSVGFCELNYILDERGRLTVLPQLRDEFISRLVKQRGDVIVQRIHVLHQPLISFVIHLRKTSVRGFNGKEIPLFKKQRLKPNLNRGTECKLAVRQIYDSKTEICFQAHREKMRSSSITEVEELHVKWDL